MTANFTQPPDGVFKAKVNPDSDNGYPYWWGWAVILPYVDRQKYTIDDKYISWETQGQFVFFKRNPVDALNWSFGLEIFCDLGSYWVKAVEGNGNGICKNSVKLNDKEKTKLNFGDEFIMTKLQNDVRRRNVVFTFNKRNYPENWDKCEKICGSETSTDLDFTLDRNELIFSKILSHLSVGSLKNARLVCRHWDEQVSPILRRKCAINLANPYGHNPSLIFFRYVHEMQNAAKNGRMEMSDWSNWKITFPELPVKDNDLENWRDKFVTDLTWFLQPGMEYHHVKTLSLKGDINSDQDYGLYLDTVSKFKDTLEELCLDFHIKLWDEEAIDEEYNSTAPGLFFNVLKQVSLRLSEPSFSDCDPDTVNTSWLKTWADAITQVTSISIAGMCFLGSRFVQELQTTGTSRYKNLREIQLTCKPEVAINFLAELDQPLKKMMVTLPLENQHLRDFENLLGKFAPSLELLSFRAATDKLEKESSFVLTLPCFPALKSFDFHFGTFEDTWYYSEPYDVHCLFKNVARLSLAFPGGLGDRNTGIDYGRHLPSIRSIVVTPLSDYDDESDFWATYSDLIDSLLPKEEGQSCKTLQDLAIWWDGIKPDTGYRQAARLPKVFPNVRNLWMDRLKERIDN